MQVCRKGQMSCEATGFLVQHAGRWGSTPTTPLSPSNFGFKLSNLDIRAVNVNFRTHHGMTILLSLFRIVIRRSESPFRIQA